MTVNALLSELECNGEDIGRRGRDTDNGKTLLGMSSQTKILPKTTGEVVHNMGDRINTGVPFFSVVC